MNDITARGVDLIATESAAPCARDGAPVEDSADRSYDLFRADAYALLAALFARPAGDDLRLWLQQIELDDNPQSLMREAWSVLQLAAQRGNTEQIEDEFQTLFIGLGRGEVVPFASWYLTGFLMERPLVLLRADLQRLGFERDEEVKEPEDHIAALCEVMAMLVNPDYGYSSEDQQRFFNQHLGPWMQRLFIDVQNAKAAHFYSAASRFGEIFIQLEQLYLEPEAGS